jgi:hypothetical protein
MAKVGKGFVLLLDLDHVISAPEKSAALQLAAEEAPGVGAGAQAPPSAEVSA